jgi:hypothetical protein
VLKGENEGIYVLCCLKLSTIGEPSHNNFIKKEPRLHIYNRGTKEKKESILNNYKRLSIHLDRSGSTEGLTMCLRREISIIKPAFKALMA